MAINRSPLTGFEQHKKISALFMFKAAFIVSLDPGIFFEQHVDRLLDRAPDLDVALIVSDPAVSKPQRANPVPYSDASFKLGNVHFLESCAARGATLPG